MKSRWGTHFMTLHNSIGLISKGSEDMTNKITSHCRFWPPSVRGPSHGTPTTTMITSLSYISVLASVLSATTTTTTTTTTTDQTKLYVWPGICPPHSAVSTRLPLLQLQLLQEQLIQLTRLRYIYRPGICPPHSAVSTRLPLLQLQLLQQLQQLTRLRYMSDLVSVLLTAQYLLVGHCLLNNRTWVFRPWRKRHNRIIQHLYVWQAAYGNSITDDLGHLYTASWSQSVSSWLSVHLQTYQRHTSLLSYLVSTYISVLVVLQPLPKFRIPFLWTFTIPSIPWFRRQLKSFFYNLAFRPHKPPAHRLRLRFGGIPLTLCIT